MKSTPIVLKKLSLNEFSYRKLRKVIAKILVVVELMSGTYRIPNKEATFTNSTVADKQHFEEVVMGVHLILLGHFEYFLKSNNYLQNLIVQKILTSFALIIIINLH